MKIIDAKVIVTCPGRNFVTLIPYAPKYPILVTAQFE